MHKIPEKIVYSIFAIASLAAGMEFDKAALTLVFAGGYIVLATKNPNKK